ncbi:MAG: universal stress protein [Deltaproteobacteria bacterium]|nr:universal stress protein [Deltaproteobacteria bacterium]
MFEKILYPTDFSDVSKKALIYVKGLRGAGAQKGYSGPGHKRQENGVYQKGNCLGRQGGFPFLSQAVRSLEEEALQEIRPIEDELKRAGFAVKIRLENGVPELKILEIAESEKVAAIVLGSMEEADSPTALLGRFLTT